MLKSENAYASKSPLSALSSDLLPAGVVELTPDHLEDINGGNFVGDVVMKAGKAVSENVSPRAGGIIAAIGNLINSFTD